MKRLSILVVVALLAGCVGCSEPVSEQGMQEQSTQEQEMSGLANPWEYDVSAQDVKDLTGTEFIVPEGASDVAYGIMEAGKLAEMDFTLDGKSFTARMKPAADFEDISGLFYEWDAEGADEIGGAEACVRINFAENVSSVLWHDGSMMYSLYTSDGDKEGAEAVNVARLICGVAETSDGADYDMYGYVVDKLPEDQYYSHYNVKGDNDEIYICNYNGNDELAEGTYVGMFQIGDGWTLEVIGGEPEVSDEAVITDENGVTVTDMEIMINTPETCTFDFTLNNDTGKDLTFDQTKIRLENFDGTVLDPFGGDTAPIDAPWGIERHSFTMDLGGIKSGDEISVYYDDEYIAGILVGGGPKASDNDSLQDLENFFADIDLEEYTKMVMEQAKEGEKQYPVTLEKKEKSEDVNPVDGGLFITADGVECRSLKLCCPNDVFSFGIELYNETGTDKTFDQTRFVIEAEDGGCVNPFVFEQTREPETVDGEMKRLWMAYTIYNPKDLKEGDEVSVYYNGVFITKLSVEKDL